MSLDKIIIKDLVHLMILVIRVTLAFPKVARVQDAPSGESTMHFGICDNSKTIFELFDQ